MRRLPPLPLEVQEAPQALQVTPSCCPHPFPHRGHRASVLGAAGPVAA